MTLSAMVVLVVSVLCMFVNASVVTPARVVVMLLVGRALMLAAVMGSTAVQYVSWVLLVYVLMWAGIARAGTLLRVSIALLAVALMMTGTIPMIFGISNTFLVLMSAGIMAQILSAVGSPACTRVVFGGTSRPLIRRTQFAVLEPLNDVGIVVVVYPLSRVSSVAIILNLRVAGASGLDELVRFAF